MVNQIKVPKEIQDIFTEAEACEALAAHYARWFIPSPKALYYTIRAKKLERLAWRTAEKVAQTVLVGWAYDRSAGTAFASLDTSDIRIAKPKKPRAPRKPRNIAAAALAGDVKCAT